MSFLAFILTVVVWLPNGDFEPVMSRAFTSEADCLTAGYEVEGDIRAMNAGEPSTMRMTWHWDCRLLLNDSEKVGA